MRQLNWYEYGWWVSIRELVTVGSIIVGLIGAGIALATFVNTLAVRKQDLLARKFNQTVAVIEDYNDKRISVINDYVSTIDEFMSEMRVSYSHDGSEEQNMRMYFANAAHIAKVAEVLHYLNLLGYFVENESYISKTDLIQSFGSELFRYFSQPRYQYPIKFVLPFTTMKYVVRLFDEVGVNLNVGGMEDGHS